MNKRSDITTRIEYEVFRYWAVQRDWLCWETHDVGPWGVEELVSSPAFAVYKWMAPDGLVIRVDVDDKGTIEAVTTVNHDIIQIVDMINEMRG